jgi:hypothetical protein
VPFPARRSNPASPAFSADVAAGPARVGGHSATPAGAAPPSSPPPPSAVRCPMGSDRRRRSRLLPGTLGSRRRSGSGAPGSLLMRPAATRSRLPASARRSGQVTRRPAPVSAQPRWAEPCHAVSNEPALPNPRPPPPHPAASSFARAWRRWRGNDSIRTRGPWRRPVSLSRRCERLRSRAHEMLATDEPEASAPPATSRLHRFGIAVVPDGSDRHARGSSQAGVGRRGFEALARRPERA